jgi:hypothetical protein
MTEPLPCLVWRWLNHPHGPWQWFGHLKGQRKKKLRGFGHPKGKKKKKKKKKSLALRGGRMTSMDHVVVWPPLDRPKRKWLNHPMTLGDGSATSKSQIPYHCFEGTSVPQNSVAELPHE